MCRSNSSRSVARETATARLQAGAQALVGAALALTLLSGCGGHAADDPVEREIEMLRREHAELREELVRLREEILALESQRGDTSRAAVIGPGEVPRGVRLDERDSVHQLLEAYRLAIEAGDVDGLRDQVYPDGIPERDERIIRLLIDRTRDRTVDLRVGDIELEDGRAFVFARQRMEYELRRTGEFRQADLRLELVLERSPDGWRIRHLRIDPR